MRKRSIEAQAIDLSRRVPRAEIQVLQGIYLGAGGGIAWYDVPTISEQCADGIKALLKRHPNLATERGLRPRLRANGPPKLNRIFSSGDHSMIEYAVRDSSRARFTEYERIVEPHDHLYRLTPLQDPATLELRVGHPTIRLELINAFAKDLGIDPPVSQIYRVRGARVDELSKELEARLVKAKLRTAGGGVKSIEIEADEVHGLSEAKRYSDEIELGSEETLRGYEFVTSHPDGYSEKAVVEIVLHSSEMKVSSWISERAILNLRRSVVKFATIENA